MENYYHILHISPTASAAELEAAMDALYQDNQQKARLTHNRDVADEANRMLRLLEEQIRPTLTDPARRAAYDAQLAEAERTGGLADPGAQQGGPILPPRPEKPGKSGPQPVVAPVDAWVCPSCGTASARGTRHCNRCSTQLGIDCPKCGKLTLKNAPFCEWCGANLQAEIERQVMEKRAQEAAAVKQRLAALQTQVQAEEQEIIKLDRLRTSLLPWVFADSFTNRHLGCLGDLIAATAMLVTILLPFALLFSMLQREPGAFIVLMISAAMVGQFLGAVIKRAFSQAAILKELETRRLRIAELETEIRALSSSTVQ
jgi:hypothetical protein